MYPESCFLYNLKCFIKLIIGCESLLTTGCSMNVFQGRQSTKRVYLPVFGQMCGGVKVVSISSLFILFIELLLALLH